MQTPREIFRRIMHYQQPERMLVWHWGFGLYGSAGWDGYWPGPGTHFWQNTIDRWHGEGLPAQVNTKRRVNDYFGTDRRLQLDLRILLWPHQTPTVLEEHDGFRIVVGDSGRITKVFSGAMTETSMPEYLSYPLTSREAWKKFARERLDPTTPGREGFRILKDGATLIESAPGALNFQEARDLLLHSELPVEVFAGSLFGYIREWMGLKSLAYTLYDDAAWMQEMMDHFADLTLSVMSRVLDALDVPIDHAQWWEDMAYNAGPLISPKHVRHLMLPGYRRVNDYLRKRGVDVISVDSDGKIDALIPIWLDSGINCMFPNEVAAGNDVFAMRAKYGRDLLLIGGIDKRALAEGKPAIRQELERRLPLVTQGGYIPEIDHSVPHDISFEDYQYYHRTLQEESLRYLREWAA